LAKSPSKIAADGRNRRRSEPLRVLVIRHAVAKDRGEFAGSGLPDADRPLTAKGRRKMRRAARGLVRLVPDVGVIASSPLTRAVETAEILAKRYCHQQGEVDALQLSVLAPGKPNNLLLDWLDGQPRSAAVAIVGHEPHLGQFVSWALTGLRDSFVELKKGAVVLLEFADQVRPGQARLLWALGPGHLRTIGAAS